MLGSNSKKRTTDQSIPSRAPFGEGGNQKKKSKLPRGEGVSGKEIQSAFKRVGSPSGGERKKAAFRSLDGPDGFIVWDDERGLLRSCEYPLIRRARSRERCLLRSTNNMRLHPEGHRVDFGMPCIKNLWTGWEAAFGENSSLFSRAEKEGKGKKPKKS